MRGVHCFTPFRASPRNAHFKPVPLRPYDVTTINNCLQRESAMDEVETKQYCVTVKVWVWAEDANRAEDIVFDEMEYLVGADTPVRGFEVGQAAEDKEP